MPANLPPEYFEAEKRFKQAGTPSEKIVALEDLLSTIPKHKGTDKLRADLRRRLSQLRKEAASKKKGGRGDRYVVQKEGAVQIALVGFPNSGKSSLLACLTNANPVIADYPLSTLVPLPGMMPFEDIQFQLVDLPPIGNEATDGWVSGILRYADAMLLVINLTEDPDIQAELLIDQLDRWNIHLRTRTEIRKSSDKVPVGVFKRTLVAANKIDLVRMEDDFFKLETKYRHLYQCIAVSALKKENLEELKRALFEVSEIIRVYSKPPGKEPDIATPFTIPKGSTIIDLASFIHKDFLFHLKYARVWGSAKFDGQRVEKNHILKDRDIVELNA
ncbi:MAG TPA: TGS domain-containing protein [Thermodesulfovibrionales bacterium]|jgi:ribosome-interacting GTPase 1|nr:TGS domain-containing protein [Thermodesulfovibrionales bacterium]